MWPDSSFIYNQPLTDLVPVTKDGERVHRNYLSVVKQIEWKCGEDVASLFAKPVDSRDPATQEPGIAWHWRRGGTPEPLADLDAVAQQDARNTLRGLLDRLRPALADKDIGPTVASWLNVRSPRDIVVIGRDPFIMNWGLLPADVAASPELRHGHFAAVFGAVTPDLPLPPFDDAEFAIYSYAPEVLEPTDTAMAQTISPTPPPDAERPTLSSLRAPIVATATAAGLLLLLSLPGVLRYWSEGGGQDIIDAQAKIKADENAALQDRLKQLRDALKKDACRPLNQGEAVDPLLPQPPEKVQVQPPPVQPGAAPPAQTNLADFIDHSSVLVITHGNGFISHGSGFFISPTQIVTNKHVVNSPGQLQVYNAFFGLVPAKIVAMNPGDPVAGDDFAVLEVSGVAGTPTALNYNAQRLDQVTAVGFPEYLAKSDPAFDRIKGGDGSAKMLPFTMGGIVSGTHTHPGTAAEVVGHSAEIAEGASGGPLINNCGWVLGVNTYYTTEEGQKMRWAARYAQSAKSLADFLQSKNIVFHKEEGRCSGQTAAAPPAAAAPAQPAAPPGPATPPTPPAAKKSG